MALETTKYGEYFVSHEYRGWRDEPPKPRPGEFPDRDAYGRTADPQLGSPLFQRLPLEIREQIYEAAWEQAGLVRHIIMKDNRFMHVPCVTDHDAPEDERQVKLRKLEAQSDGDSDGGQSGHNFQDPVWARRLLSPWSNHWRCEEAAIGVMSASQGTEPTPTPFLAILLCCKRMYLESRTRLYQKLIFTFHHANTAALFFGPRQMPIAAEIRNLQLSIWIGWYLHPRDERILSNPEPDEPYDGSEACTSPKGKWGSVADEWLFLRDALAKLAPSLRRLRIWVDAYDYDAREQLLDDWAHEGAWLFSFHPRLLPVTTLSIPVNELRNTEPTWLERQTWVRRREHTLFWAYSWKYPTVLWRPEDVEELEFWSYDFIWE